MTKLIYIVVHTNGLYSDYTEETIGVFDTKQAALDAARDAVSAWNRSDDRRSDWDEIWLRRFPLNEMLAGISEAQRVAEAKTDSFGKMLYLFNGDYDNPLLVEVRDEAD